MLNTTDQALCVPKDAHSVTPLAKTIAISTEKGIVIADQTVIVLVYSSLSTLLTRRCSATRQMISVVPNFGGATPWLTRRLAARRLSLSV
jgi:hypothetical protein